jgi:hypothetical protein
MIRAMVMTVFPDPIASPSTPPVNKLKNILDIDGTIKG